MQDKIDARVHVQGRRHLRKEREDGVLKLVSRRMGRVHGLKYSRLTIASCCFFWTLFCDDRKNHGYDTINYDKKRKREEDAFPFTKRDLQLAVFGIYSSTTFGKILKSLGGINVAAFVAWFVGFVVKVRAFLNGHARDKPAKR